MIASTSPFLLRSCREDAERDETLRELRAMLVLSRRKNEKIVINGEITLTVVEIRGDKVRLGVEAPRDVRVNRWEIHEAIQREITNSNCSQPEE